MIALVLMAGYRNFGCWNWEWVVCICDLTTEGHVRPRRTSKRVSRGLSDDLQPSGFLITRGAQWSNTYSQAADITPGWHEVRKDLDRIKHFP